MSRSALVVGPVTAERPAIVDALRRAGFEVEDEEDSATPSIVIAEDGGDIAGRAATVARLRVSEALVRVPFVVVSPDAGIDSFAGAYSVGAAAFVRAPVDPAELADVADRLVSWRPRRTWRERRRPRRPILLDVDVDVPGHGLGRGRIVDISAGGCRIEMGLPAKAGQKIGIIPRAVEDSTDIRLGGLVRWAGSANGQTTTAVRWTGTSGMIVGRFTPSEPS